MDLFDLRLCNLDYPRFGNKNKPQPDIYHYVAKTLFGKDEAAQKVIAFEDTQVSLASPMGAKIKCVAVPSEWAVDHDFSSAVRRVKEVTDIAVDSNKAIEVLSKMCEP